MAEQIFDSNTLILLFRIATSFAFLGSLFVFLLPDTYVKVNNALMKEYGMRNKLIPWLETEKKSVDVWILKKRGAWGVIFITVSFLLLISVR